MLKGVPLPDGLALTSDRECGRTVRWLCLLRRPLRCVPPPVLWRPCWSPAALVSVSMGIEKDTSLTLTDAIAQEAGRHPIVALGGG